jgi:NADPH-dependent curcumin reductase
LNNFPTHETSITRFQPQQPHVVCPARPVGARRFSSDEVPIPLPTEGEFLSRTIFLSLDPYYRNVMKNSPIYAERLAAGDVMIGERW